MNIHSKKLTSISLHLISSSNELMHQLILAKIIEIEQLQFLVFRDPLPLAFTPNQSECEPLEGPGTNDLEKYKGSCLSSLSLFKKLPTSALAETPPPSPDILYGIPIRQVTLESLILLAHVLRTRAIKTQRSLSHPCVFAILIPHTRVQKI